MLHVRLARDSRLRQRDRSNTANQRSFVFTAGATVDALRVPPADTGLGPGGAGPLSACGKWLNAAYVDAGGTVHGYFHQWQCDYARGGYTNKSVGYAMSTDGGITFVPAAAQLIAGANTSAVHQLRQ